MRARWGALLVTACLMSAACGARVPADMRQKAAQAALNRGGGADSAGAASGGAEEGAAAREAGASSSGGSARGAAAGAGESGSAAASAPAAASAGAAAPAGGNGGATDVGVTANSILAGQLADVTGPVPGIFQGAVVAAKAYFNYVNSQGGVFGRQLKLVSADGQTDCAAAQNATQGLVDKVFAFAGSFEIYDDCQSEVLRKYPKIPDVSYPISVQHKQLPSNFSASPAPPGYPTGLFQYFSGKLPAGATKNVGVIWNNVPAGAFLYRSMAAAAEAAGWKITYNRGITPTESSFTADVVRMRSQGVQVFWTSFMTAGQSASVIKAQQQQGWHPINVLPTAYDQSFLKVLGNDAAAEGIMGWNQWSLFYTPSDARNVPEVARFQEWVEKTAPGTSLDLYSMHAWANAALFVHALREVGPNLTRARLMDYLRRLTDYDGGGGFVPRSSPGTKGQSTCYVVWVIRNGKYLRQDTPPTGYRCDGIYFNYKGN